MKEGMCLRKYCKWAKGRPVLVFVLEAVAGVPEGFLDFDIKFTAERGGIIGWTWREAIRHNETVSYQKVNENCSARAVDFKTFGDDEEEYNELVVLDICNQTCTPNRLTVK